MPRFPEKLDTVRHLVIHAAVGDATLAEAHPFFNMRASPTQRGRFAVSTDDEYDVRGWAQEIILTAGVIRMITLRWCRVT